VASRSYFQRIHQFTIRLFSLLQPFQLSFLELQTDLDLDLLVALSAQFVGI